MVPFSSTNNSPRSLVMTYILREIRKTYQQAHPGEYGYLAIDFNVDNHNDYLIRGIAPSLEAAKQQYPECADTGVRRRYWWVGDFQKSPFAQKLHEQWVASQSQPDQQVV